MPSFPRSVRTTLALLLPVLAWAGWVGGAAEAGSHWLPDRPLIPRALADLREPRIGLTYAPEPDHLDAALGAPLPILGISAGEAEFQAVLEGAAFLRLGRDGTFFPLRTVDGLFGLGVEGSSGPWRARLRLMHASAHKADGDSTVAFRGQTSSKEFWVLEGGYTWGTAFVFARVGSSWHAVPRDRGADLAWGGQWEGRARGGRPFAGILLETDAERNWRVSQSFLAGWATGWERFFRVALRFFNGNSRQGQYWNSVERYFGLDLHFSP